MGNRKGGKKLRILLVDDETDFLMPIAYWLRAEGAEVQTASSGQEALQMIQQDPPDIVFLDIYMPGKDGIETLRELRAMNRTLPVVMVTAYPDDKENFSNAIKMGISGFFPKQGKLSELKFMIETSLKIHAAPGSASKPATL